MRELPSQAIAFLHLAEAAKWDARALPADLFAGRADAKLLGGTLLARRGDEVITATWLGGSAVGPIGWHSSGSTSHHPLKNASQAADCLNALPGHHGPQWGG